MGAQAVAPPRTSAQMVPPQQASLVGSQLAPTPLQAGPDGAAVTGEQIKLPGAPIQAPSQQSSVAPQGAPLGAQEW